MQFNAEDASAFSALQNSSSSFLTDYAADTMATAASLDLLHTYAGKVSVLSLTLEQYHNFSIFLCQAQALDYYNTGAILVNCLPNQHQELCTPLPTFTSSKCLRYEVQLREKSVYEIACIFCKDTITLTFSTSQTHCTPASDLVCKMENL